MQTQPARILIIDDDADILEVIRRHLRTNGFKVICAQTGEQGLRILAEQSIDVTLCDEVMPGMQGTEVLTRSLENRIDTPFIMVTGFGEGEIVRKALRLGAFDFIDKPIKLEELLLSVSRAVEFSRRLRSGTADAPLQEGERVVDPDRIDRDRRVASLLRLVNGNRRKMR